jgi:hypothetical protein
MHLRPTLIRTNLPVYAAGLYFIPPAPGSFAGRDEGHGSLIEANFRRGRITPAIAHKTRSSKGLCLQFPRSSKSKIRRAEDN